jgi:hypothetical protein
MPIEPPVSATARAWTALIWRPVGGVDPIAFDPHSAVCDKSSDLVATLTACFTVSSVACATSQSNSVTGADHLGAKRGESLMRDRTCLEVADVVRCVVYELHVPNATLVRFLEPLVLPDELPRDQPRKAHAQVMTGDHLVNPGQSIEMVFVKEARFRCTQCRKYTGLIPAEDRTIGDVGEACDGK